MPKNCLRNWVERQDIVLTIKCDLSFFLRQSPRLKQNIAFIKTSMEEPAVKLKTISDIVFRCSKSLCFFFLHRQIHARSPGCSVTRPRRVDAISKTRCGVLNRRMTAFGSITWKPAWPYEQVTTEPSGKVTAWSLHWLECSAKASKQAEK